MAVALFARARIAQATVTSVAVVYNKISDGTAYTPVVGDVCVVFLVGTKSSAGNSTVTGPGGAWLFGGGPNGQDNGGLNCTGAALVCAAQGTSADSPTIAVSSAVWQAECYVLSGADTSTLPYDPTTLPQVPNKSTATGGNTGVALTTRVANELVLSLLATRAPNTINSLAWAGGSTVDQALAGGTNNFMSTATQLVAAASTVTPSATWTGGSGTASLIYSLAFAPAGMVTGTTRQVQRSGWEAATRKVQRSGQETASRRVYRGGAWVRDDTGLYLRAA